ncbi:MAG: hypothetical protein ACYDGN_09465 [Acidimicrobiales bacterium]
MKFRTGFVVGAAVGAWAASKASGLQRGRRRPPAKGSGVPAADEAAEKLRAFSGLARERLADIVEGPLGNMARERIAEVISSTLSGAKSSGNGTVDTTARWPR